MITVYHHRANKDTGEPNLFALDFHENYQEIVVERFQGGHYHKIALVDTNDLETAYRLTNHIDCCGWDENKEISWKAEGGQRSTSCGDLLLTEDGKYHLVASCGFEEISIDISPPKTTSL